MTSSNASLQTVAIKWREHLTERRARISASIAVQLSSHDQPTSASADDNKMSVSTRIRSLVWPIVTAELVTECESWLLALGSWPSSIGSSELRAELESASALVPLSTIWREVPTISINLKSWVVLSLTATYLGGLIFGHWLGAFIFSAGAMIGIVSLLNQDRIQAHLRSVHLTLFSANDTSCREAPMTLLRRLFVTGRNQQVRYWLEKKLATFLVKSRRDPHSPLTLLQIQEVIDDDFDRCSTYVLALCWARATQGATELDGSKSIHLDGQTPYDSIGGIEYVLRKSPEDLLAVRDAAVELVQAMANAGYSWKLIPDGEPFAKTLRREFETFGHLEEGQPVKTLRRALCYRDSVVVPGVLTRIRG